MRHALLALGCFVAIQLVACGGDEPSDRWNQALSYARHDIACTMDADCCAVFSQCSATALIVGAADKAKVEQLIPSVTEADTCVSCIPPPVQVRCENKLCVGSELKNTSGTYTDVQSFMATHCGAMTVPVGWKADALKSSSGFALPISSLPYTIGCGS